MTSGPGTQPTWAHSRLVRTADSCAPGMGGLAYLAVAARGGDRRAMDQLLGQVRPRLIRMALTFGAPPGEVPDLVQEVLLGAWRNLQAFDPDRGSFLAWMGQGLYGRVANLRRGRGRRTRFFDRLRDEQGDEVTTAERPHGVVEARITLDKLLAALSPRQRAVVALYELGGLSGKEAASVLGIRESTVRSIARDARKHLTQAALRVTLAGERVAS